MDWYYTCFFISVNLFLKKFNVSYDTSKDCHPSFSKVTLDNLNQMAHPLYYYHWHTLRQYSLSCVLENNTINNNVNKIFIFMALYTLRGIMPNKKTKAISGFCWVVNVRFTVVFYLDQITSHHIGIIKATIHINIT
jgi:hypothetical protein